MPKVSVIIPAYNAMHYLPETLFSALNQTYQDFEIIVVNDGSSDEIETWIAQLDEPKIKLISQQNQGATGARNTGIQASTGEYIAFLDADDIWHTTKLEKQVAVLDQYPEVGLVYTWVENINNQSQRTGRILKHEVEGYIWTQLLEHNVVECGSTPMVRHQIFDTLGLFDRALRSFQEDWDMWLRIAVHYPFKVIKEPLVQYRQHAASGSKNWDAMAHSFHKVMEKAFESNPSSNQQALKRKSYGHFYLFCLAWKPLQNQATDYRQAHAFLTQALLYDPQLKFTKEYWRLSIAITLMRLLGPHKYQSLLNYGYSWRRRFSQFADRSSRTSPKPG